MMRRDIDWLLLEDAIRAGCQFEQSVPVREAILAHAGGEPVVVGARVGANGSARELRARVTIAADGRRSAIAFGLGLARHPATPRRWAIGAYFENVLPPNTTINAEPAAFAECAQHAPSARPAERGVLVIPRVLRGTPVLGEMHIRRGRYIGIAPVPGGITNVCLVRPSRPGDGDLRRPAALLLRELASDSLLRDRFARARLVSPPVVLGPLAVDTRAVSIRGLLLAGDAAGFIDPMTGDGLRFAVRGGELAAVTALEALEHGWTGAHARLEWRRRREFGGKQWFNRALRALVASPRAVAAAAVGARVAPFVLRNLIARAGDCDLAETMVA
jgi:flavin-dependent dehydrogenase